MLSAFPKASPPVSLAFQECIVLCFIRLQHKAHSSMHCRGYWLPGFPSWTPATHTMQRHGVEIIGLRVGMMEVNRNKVVVLFQA